MGGGIQSYFIKMNMLFTIKPSIIQAFFSLYARNSELNALIISL